MKFALITATNLLVAVALLGCGAGASSQDDSFDPVDSAWAQALTPLESYCDGLKEQAAKRGVKTLTEVELPIYTIWMFDEEVQNGGFSQYFYNQAGALAPDTLIALRNLPANRHADWL